MAKSFTENAVVNSLGFKQSVKVATTANITLSGAQAIDGVAVVAGDRVLVKNQTTGSQNGIYVVSTGSWQRSLDANESSEVSSNFIVFVEQGTVNGDRGWMLTTNSPITLGSTSLQFSEVTSPYKTDGGTKSIVGSGLSNTASGNYSVVSGGSSNTASGTHSVVCGGTQNTAGSTYGTILGGTTNNTSTYTNVFILGSNITATANDTSYVNNLKTAGQIDAGNVRISSNTISSTNSNGNISISPNGSGKVLIGNPPGAGYTFEVDGTINATQNIYVNEFPVSIDGWVVAGTISSGAVSTDVSGGRIFDITLSENITLENPTNPFNGVTIRWRIQQDATGGRTVALGNKFVIPSSASSPLPWSTAANAMDILAATYHSDRDKWDIVAFVPGY